jgi:predicted DNA-binding antitoxin AbrB/MazE fold protein
MSGSRIIKSLKEINMTHSIQAVYEKGLLKPLEKLSLHEGEMIKVILLKKKTSPKANAVYKAITDIAEMPLEGDNKAFSGKNHDSLLYGSFHK